jgi:hypothetical protein
MYPSSSFERRKDVGVALAIDHCHRIIALACVNRETCWYTRGAPSDTREDNFVSLEGRPASRHTYMHFDL